MNVVNYCDVNFDMQPPVSVSSKKIETKKENKILQGQGHACLLETSIRNLYLLT